MQKRYKILTSHVALIVIIISIKKNLMRRQLKVSYKVKLMELKKDDTDGVLNYNFSNTFCNKSA